MSSNKEVATVTTLRPSAAREAFRINILNKQPTFVWGPPGIGKSEIMASLAAELGMDFVDIRLSQMDPVDLRGMPFPGTGPNGESVLQMAPPSFYLNPNRPNARPVLYFLDEMNAAPQSIQAAAYQVVQDRRIGEYKLGKDDVVFAAGNRDTDRGATFKMPTPLANRFLHVEMRSDFKDWQIWALQNDVHRDVVAYLSFQPQDLNDFNASSASRGFPTPRSWFGVSKLLRNEIPATDEVLHALIEGLVGPGRSTKFIAFRKLNEALPSPDDILTGKVTKLNAKTGSELSMQYALVLGVAYELKARYDAAQATKDKAKFKHWHKEFDRFLTFMLDNISRDIVYLGVRTLTNTFRLIEINMREVPSWSRYAEVYSKLTEQF